MVVFLFPLDFMRLSAVIIFVFELDTKTEKVKIKQEKIKKDKSELT